MQDLNPKTGMNVLHTVKPIDRAKMRTVSFPKEFQSFFFPSRCPGRLFHTGNIRKDTGKEMTEKNGCDSIEYAKENEKPDIRHIGTESGKQGPHCKSSITAKRKSAHGFSLIFTGQIIDHTSCFGMINGRPQTGQHGKQEK